MSTPLISGGIKSALRQRCSACGSNAQSFGAQSWADSASGSDGHCCRCAGRAFSAGIKPGVRFDDRIQLHVHFIPYGKIYGEAPRNFVFSRYGCKVLIKRAMQQGIKSVFQWNQHGVHSELKEERGFIGPAEQGRRRGSRDRRAWVPPGLKCFIAPHRA